MMKTTQRFYGKHTGGHMEERKKQYEVLEETEESSEITIITRLQSQGYTEHDITKFKKALNNPKGPDSEMEEGPCRCKPKYICERCNILLLRKTYGNQGNTQ